MKIRNKMLAVGLSALVMLCGIVSTYAYTYETGNIYQTVKYIDLPGGGKWVFNTSLGSKKMNSTTLATFNKVWGQAALGNYGTLTTVSKASVSEEQGLATNRPTWLSEHGTSKGGVYFSAVSSHDYEPSNTCDLTLRFSADTLDLPN